MNDHTLRKYDSMLGLLCDVDNPTPIVKLNRVTPYKHTTVYAKLEWYNPFGAVKDRIAANLVADAEERGELDGITKLVEPTSGNTGMGLAMIANAKGYTLTTPLSDAIPQEKRSVLRPVLDGLRSLGLALPARIDATLNALGQVPFVPPDVSGWPANGAWLSTASARTRLEAAQGFARLAVEGTQL